MQQQSLFVREKAARVSTRPTQIPLYATSSFEFENIEEGIQIFQKEKPGDVYSRYANPTVTAVQEKLAQLESYETGSEASALLCGSGMSAISTLLMSCLQKGDALLTQANLYGGTTELLMKVMQPLGIEPIFINLKNLQEVEHRLQTHSNIKMIFGESPANPTLACIDLEALAGLGRKYGVRTAIDNTFCTPFIQRPLRWGIDFVVHSTTKYLNGHGNSLAGVIIGRDQEFIRDTVWTRMKLLGTTCPPFDAWLLNIGLKTLPLRMQQHSANALAVATFLKRSSKVTQVNCTGLPGFPDAELAKKQMRMPTGMLSFELKGGVETGIRFMNALQFCRLAPTLGDVDTLVLHPASMSHINIDREVRLQNGITDGLIRLSVGIEDVNDIIEDLELGLRSC